MHSGGTWVGALVVASSLGCGRDGTSRDGGPVVPGWRGDLPAARQLGGARGLQPVRAILHVHSPYSHDACDGAPRDRVTGAVNEPCLADLRAGLCAARVGFAALTDHDDSMADEEFDELFLRRGTDQAILDGNRQPIASRITCEDGHQVLVTVGGENALMPLALDGHVPGDVATRHATYNASDLAAADALRAAGATLWIPHTESRTFAELDPLSPDGVEIYQLHANLDADLRQEFLGLPPGGAIAAIADFVEPGDDAPEGDLAFLAFVEPNPPALARWDELLAAGHHVAGSAGTDAHQNVDIALADGQRADSYRRTFRWFSNLVLTANPDDPLAIEEALRLGRIFVAFELFGSPVGFDVRLVTPTGPPAELGDTTPATPGATLEVTLPTVWHLDPSLPTPEISARILRVGGAGTVELATGSDRTLSTPAELPGAYRVEILIRPRHLAPYLGRLGASLAERQRVWIYASPIYVTASSSSRPARRW